MFAGLVVAVFFVAGGVLTLVLRAGLRRSLRWEEVGLCFALGAPAIALIFWLVALPMARSLHYLAVGP